MFLPPWKPYFLCLYSYNLCIDCNFFHSSYQKVQHAGMTDVLPEHTSVTPLVAYGVKS